MSLDPAGPPPVGPFRLGGYWLTLGLIALFTLWPVPLGLKSIAVVTLPMGALAGAIWLVALLVGWNAHVRRRAGVARSTPRRANFVYYALALAAIGALGYATLSGWLPAAVLFLVAFAAIFWLISFLFALAAALRRKPGPK